MKLLLASEVSAMLVNNKSSEFLIDVYCIHILSKIYQSSTLSSRRDLSNKKFNYKSSSIIFVLCLKRKREKFSNFFPSSPQRSVGSSMLIELPFLFEIKTFQCNSQVTVCFFFPKKKNYSRRERIYFSKYKIMSYKETMWNFVNELRIKCGH